ncbi:Endoribonuclease Dicer-like [Melia azedarach]|uniref:Endoribonuclease Dicer-like n=1 Tax=Melia azedarach TaxID=155640 RepID=A0ACC1YE08_MELAZ|nr:Endoribonuclease Dicer-like [Melia azedarach]
MGVVNKKMDTTQQGSGSEPGTYEQPIYFPPELVNQCPQESKITYHCYLIELKQKFDFNVSVHDIVLATRTELESDIIANMNLDLQVDRGILTVNLKHIGVMHLTPEEVLTARRFQITLFRVLIDRSTDKVREILDGFQLGNNLEMDYLLLPFSSSRGQWIDWNSVESVLVSCDNVWKNHTNCSMEGNAGVFRTKTGPLCTCMIQNSLVYTPHNGNIYCVMGVLEDLNANSIMRGGSKITYKEHYERRHGIQLCFDQQLLLSGRDIFRVQNYLIKCRQQKKKEPSNTSVQLPPELCRLIMSPVSVSTIYSFTFVPSIMHRLQSLLLAVNLKKMLLDHCTQNLDIPTVKVLEAITTTNCQESYNLKSLATLGDSFLKYAVSQHLFKTYQKDREGLLTAEKEKVISNVALCKRGFDHKLPGFIRTESFRPERWMIPGDNSGSDSLNEDSLSHTRKIYVVGTRKVDMKTVADAVEALIGAFLSTGGENAGLIFLDRIGIKVDFLNIPYDRPFQVYAERLVNVRHLESLLKYSFRDPSLLVEALTHGSYMHPEISTSYQRLEFLGDAVLDYLITVHLFKEYPELSSRDLTDMRSASVNNLCYARSSVKHGLHEHILRDSQELDKQIIITVNNFEKLSLQSTFGWESESSFCEVLADIVESLAGAIFIDSGYDKERVFQSIRPLLEPLITPDTIKFNPVSELKEFCEKEHIEMNISVDSQIDGMFPVTVEVEANDRLFRHTSLSSNTKTAKRLACQEVLKSLKESTSGT